MRDWLLWKTKGSRLRNLWTFSFWDSQRRRGSLSSGKDCSSWSSCTTTFTGRLVSTTAGTPRNSCWRSTRGGSFGRPDSYCFLGRLIYYHLPHMLAEIPRKTVFPEHGNLGLIQLFWARSPESSRTSKTRSSQFRQASIRSTSWQKDCKLSPSPSSSTTKTVLMESSSNLLRSGSNQQNAMSITDLSPLLRGVRH